nr:adenylate/guanylate cyclase domain-containing protein [Microvirga solisilvae]
MAGLIAALLTPLVFFEPFKLIEAKVFDILSIISPPKPDPYGVEVVAIDEPSFSQIGQRWPWPRTLHAQLAEHLRAAGAKVIVFDVIFSEPSTEEDDKRLAAALGPDVVLAADDVLTKLEHGVQVTRVNPIDPFLDAGAVPGVASVAPDGDIYLRQMPTQADSFAAEVLRLAGHPVQPPPEGALIQHFGPTRTYPTVSYYQALDPEEFLQPGRFKDKIVLVGLSLKAATSADAGAPDTFATAYTLTTGDLTAGVEVQATIIDNLRLGLFVIPLPRIAVLALLFGGAFLAAALSIRGVTWRTGFAALFVVILLVAGAWVVLRFERVWMPPVLPAAAALAVFGTRFGLDYARERQLRHAVSEAFSRYLSPDLVAELARDPSSLKLGGERRNLSILFCDVRGFTSLSERLKDQPERLTSLINRLLDPLSEAVLKEGGTIDKYMGDCVMAFWNAPLPRPDHPQRAVSAALHMMEAVSALNETLRREEGEDAPVFAVGIGINTGDCVVGNVGSRWRYDYSVLGDTVNLASRLESLSKEYKVSLILGPDTAEAVRDDYVLIELDRIAVRGRATESAIFTVVAPASQRHDPAIAELAETHARAIEAMREGRRDIALTHVVRCQSLAPSLADYYRTLLYKISAMRD